MLTAGLKGPRDCVQQADDQQHKQSAAKDADAVELAQLQAGKLQGKSEAEQE